MIDYKSIFGSVKDVDTKGRVVTGYLSSFGNIDSDNDIIEKGSFLKSINERMDKMRFLYQHNWQQPLSKFKVLMEDEKGLYFESDPLPDTTYANDTIKLYEAGILNEHSIGFNVIKAEYDRDTDIRRIKEIRLYEGSVVTFGANSGTPFTGFKDAFTEEEFEKERKRIDEETGKIMSALKKGSFTDETFIMLEIALKSLSKQSYELGKISLKEPSVDTQQKEPIIKEVEILNDYLKKWN